MSTIPEGEITYAELSQADKVGRLFHWKGKIYRGIYPASTEMIRDLFAGGCLEELTRRGLFPRSRITEFTTEGFGLVVEHDQIPYVVYPQEWSFDMFRDAALSVLEIVEVADRFGWILQDCHPYNILFTSARPIYVDLGAFKPKPKNRDDGFGKGHDFLRLYWRPLYLWALGDSFLSHCIISSAHANMPDFSWWLYKNYHLHVLGRKACARLAKWAAKRARKAAKLLRHGQVVAWLSPSLASRLPVDIIAQNPSLLRRKIARLNRPPPSPWDDYHSEYLKNDDILSTPRLDRILEIIRSLDCASAIELAGNQGLFTRLIVANTQVKKIVCTDYSSSAVNRFYLHCRDHPDEFKDAVVQTAVFNFMLPEIASRLSPTSERLKSDLVLALAVTHHLTLSQNFPLKEILRTIAGYTRRFAIVEFMPLGLWGGQKAPPLPGWYTKEWFERAFAEFFDLIAVEELEKNRVAFVGRLKT